MDESTYRLCEAIKAETLALSETIEAGDSEHYSDNIVKSIGCIRGRVAEVMRWK